MSKPLRIDSKSFEAQVLNSDQPVLVDFYADWCGPCQALAPVLDALSEEFAGRAKVAKVNTDENPELASQYGVRALPTMLFFEGGDVADRVIGLAQRGELSARLANLIANPAGA
ncbi:MAG: thioredoxin [Planctomycetota bacterium]|jgi:thioredoxin 1